MFKKYGHFKTRLDKKRKLFTSLGFTYKKQIKFLVEFSHSNIIEDVKFEGVTIKEVK